MSKQVKRLIDQFVPEKYRLELHPDKTNMTFTGNVIITGRKVDRPSKRVTFHQKDLKIHSAAIRFRGKQTKDIETTRINLHQSYDEVRLHTNEILYPGEYEVTLEFSGTITKPMNGLYPCFFTYNGQEKTLLATQFESHHAREVFPCIDEPAAKATYDLTLTSPKGEAVIANTPIASQSTKADITTTTFETTPVMSSYLLAFVLGEMEYLEAKTKAGTTVRTYATPDNVKFTKFALEVGVKCLDFYEEYFAIPYPLAKCDMIALPDFASGAMENWGCITYREQALLVDPKNTSVPAKQYVAMVVAHELAHQWFGNLVTMRWWTDLWLNEGFASWIEYLAVDHLFPEWNMWTQFIVDEQQPAMKLDALENTHAVEAPINHPDEIRTIFDNISYGKGASVIHMLHQYLGSEAFRDGLRYYLNKHKYGNTDTVDLWAALEYVSKKPVKAFMHQWTSQPGFPLVHARIAADNPAISQERFYAQKQEQTTKDLWPVPLLASEPLDIDILDQAEHRIRVESLRSDFLLNKGGSGFYRVVYDAAHLKQLAKKIPTNEFDTIERLMLLSDMLESAKAGYATTLDTLKLLENYADETSAPVWDIMATVISSIRAVMDEEDLREVMKPYVRNLTAKQLKRLGWATKKDEPYFDTLLRPTILGMAAVAEEPSVLKECQTRYQNMKILEDIEPDLRGVVLNTVARRGGEKEFSHFVELHNASTSAEDRLVLTAALTSFEQPELIQKSLEFIKTKDVRLQDAMYWVAYSFMNRHAKHATWEWLKKEWRWLEKNLGSDLSFSRFPIYAARSFSDSSFKQDYQAFFEPLLTPALERAYKQGLELISWQAAWKDRDLAAIKAYFTPKK